jgi:hypothetical protein
MHIITDSKVDLVVAVADQKDLTEVIHHQKQVKQVGLDVAKHYNQSLLIREQLAMDFQAVADMARGLLVMVAAVEVVLAEKDQIIPETAAAQAGQD